jgi:hypothetical protein
MDETRGDADTSADEDPTGDGDPTTGDGDGDTTTGDGDPSTGDGDGDPTTGDGDGDGAPNCTGPNGAQPAADATQPDTPLTPGSTWAHFELEDFQPQSCNFGQTTSLEPFKGRVTLVTLMRSTCMICQGTIEHLEDMHDQLTDEGYDVWFVTINQMGYQGSQQEFIDRVSFPLLQDTMAADAWALMNTPGLGTDDIYIYGADGVLRSYFNYADANPSIDLGTQGGWDTVYGAIVAASEG